jgi:glycosyltransferase involved in cell wall biosynthesis
MIVATARIQGTRPMADPGFDAFLDDLTIVAIVKNEEVQMPGFLKAHEWVPNILIYDDGSEDATAAIVRGSGHRLLEFNPLLQGFAEKRNHVQAAAETEWVLHLDADERMPRASLEEAYRTIVLSSGVCGFAFPVRNHFLGRRMRGRQWDRQKAVRMARSGKSHWVHPIHEILQVDGPVVELRGWIDHFGDDDYQRRAAKSLQYNLLEVGRMGRRPGLAEVVLRPFWEFVKYYVLKYGFVDGRPGLIFAMHVWAAWFQRLAIAHTQKTPVRDE